jgi:hypothetical protein
MASILLYSFMVLVAQLGGEMRIYHEGKGAKVLFLFFLRALRPLWSIPDLEFSSGPEGCEKPYHHITSVILAICLLAFDSLSSQFMGNSLAEAIVRSIRTYVVEYS